MNIFKISILQLKKKWYEKKIQKNTKREVKKDLVGFNPFED